MLTRRGALAGLAGLGAGLGGASARAANTLTVLSHEAMKGAASKGAGGDVLAAWRRANDCDVTWITLDVLAIGDRLLREASLGSTSLDVAYIQFPTARTLSLMAPLEPYLAADPIEGTGTDLADYTPGLLDTLKSEGTLRGLPVRVSSDAVLYNEALFAERGITAMPRTIEELADAARKLTFTRADGSKVYGLLFTASPDQLDGYAAVARCFDGDYMTQDLKITANDKAVVQSLEWLAGLFREGVVPKECLSITPEDAFAWMAQGRVGIAINVVARLPSMNDPKRSKYPGQIKVMDWPMTAALARRTYAPQVAAWSLVLPKNGAPERRKLAWSFIRELSGPAATIGQALNGNGPARISAYADPRLANEPYIAAMKTAVQNGRVVLPAFPNMFKASDIFVEEAQSTILGRKSAQDAMDEAARRVKPLVT